MAQSKAAAELARLNAASAAEFEAALGSIYEHSPWVAERAAAMRPFPHARALHDAMLSAVKAASREEQLALIRAHPELAGKEAVAGTLTAASTGEQGRLGLTSLSRAELERLAELNRRYREAHGFPAIVALRLHQSRDTVLAEIERRAAGKREAEVEAALEQIGHIARGRLAQHLGQAGGRLTTHVLDTAHGIPAPDMVVTLLVRDGAGWRKLAGSRTNSNGRTDQPMLSDLDLAQTTYRLEFAAGAYYRRRGVPLSDPPFLDVVALEFGIGDPGQHYHVPLVCTPWSYSTYRGS